MIGMRKVRGGGHEMRYWTTGRGGNLRSRLWWMAGAAAVGVLAVVVMILAGARL